MLRSILSVVIGYIAMFVFVAASFTVIHLLLGTESVFRSGSWIASNIFCIIALILSFLIAIVGGIVCIVIARSPRPPIALAVVVLLLGYLNAAAQRSQDDPGPRTGEVTAIDAAKNARQPAWYLLSLPIVGAAGVIVGARLRGSPKSRPA